ncbi:MAG: hypothetical protein ABI999_07475 [Acidobacteriota bacterium]
MKQKRTVTIEFDQVRITTRFKSSMFQWCEPCQAESEFIEETDAAEMVVIMKTQGMTIKGGELHFYHLDETKLLVCINSLINGSNAGANK